MCQKCYSNIKVVHAFLESTDDNWRNSLYIACSVCRYSKEQICGDFLFVPEASGRPVLLPVQDANTLFGLIDKSECLGSIGNAVFGSLYQKWFEQWDNENQCPFLSCSRHYLSIHC